MTRKSERLWVKADDPRLKKRHTSAHAIEVIFDSCLDHWEKNERAALDGTDPEGVHQLRIGIRRFRSALAVFGDVLPPADLAWIEPGASDILDALSPARDWDVFATQLLARLIQRFPYDQGLTKLGVAVAGARRDAHALVRATVTSEEYARYVARIRQWNARRDWQHNATRSARKKLKRPVIELARKVLTARHKRVLKRGRDFERLTVEERHRVRIAIKKLRYAVEFFSGLYKNKRAAAYLKSLRRLQDDFGNMNDVAMAEERLGALTNLHDGRTLARSAGFVLGWYENIVAVMEPSLIANWKKFAAAKPFWDS